jgi:hypothetical protein
MSVYPSVSVIFIRPNRQTLPEELVSTATLMRDLRNYGVHPRAIEDESLERHFTEETGGLLILNVRSYLARLIKSVELAKGGS